MGAHAVNSSPTATEVSVLDNPVLASLNGVHKGLAEVVGRAGRYRPDVTPFAALSDPADPAAWVDLARLVGPGNEVTLAGVDEVPPTWSVLVEVPGVQLVAAAPLASPDTTARQLGHRDVPAMLDLVGRTQPGPFRQHTIDMGRYLGIHHDGKLVAMAGERMRPPGWTEISAVCTDPAYRGHGFATALVQAVAAGIRARGETPFLHTATANTSAIRLYESLGCTLRRRLTFLLLRAPQ